MNDGAGVATVVKKKPDQRARKAAAPEPSDERVAVIVLKGSPEYREWLSGISKESLIPVASIVRDALQQWAKGRGYSAPPKR
jgi:hypothetical protein